MSPVQYFTHGPTLAYRSYGHGTRTILAFHGFGRSSEDMQVLEESLGERFTIHAFDLHFHGQSPSYPHRADEPFTPGELAGFFKAFLDSIGVERCLLFGYSLGGRIAMSILEQAPERIEGLLLAAPDGLVTSPWYRSLATSRLGRALYRRFVEDPRLIHALIDAARSLRVMSERMHRFLMGQTDSKRKRILVRDVWLSYRLIEPDLARVGRLCIEGQITIHLFFGAFDRVIPPAQGGRLAKHAPEWVSQQDLPSGHRLLGPELALAIRARLGA